MDAQDVGRIAEALEALDAAASNARITIEVYGRGMEGDPDLGPIAQAVVRIEANTRALRGLGRQDDEAMRRQLSECHDRLVGRAFGGTVKPPREVATNG
jgi:hypothetical protein